jgi:uncharacterized phage infection (PIP) family protein YhgE
LEELLAELNKLDRNQVVTGLQTHAQPIFQVIFDRGHSTATATAKAERTTLDAQLASLQEQIRQLTDQNRQLSDKAPEAAALRKQHEDAIAVLRKEYEDKLKEKDGLVAQERMNNALANLRGKLLGGSSKLDEDYAAVLVAKPELAKRLRFTSDGKVEVLQADSATPLAAPQGKDGLDLLADELKAAAPTKFVTVESDRGGGAPPAGGGAAGAGKGDMYERIRTEATARREATSKVPSARERMGIRGGAPQSA